MIPNLLGVAWGLLAAAPLVRRGRTIDAARRSRSLPGAKDRRAPTRRLGAALRARPTVVAAVRWTEAFTAGRRARRVGAEITRDLPVTIDLLAVAIGAGCTPFVALEAAAPWAPASTGRRLDAVRRDCALGAGFAEALDAQAAAAPELRPLVDALLASDRYGAPVGPALARLAAEQRAALRRRAEARARTVPVRLLFPLVFLVLPAFAVLTVVPALLTGFAR
jgi:pilus assembly protein TadC